MSYLAYSEGFTEPSIVTALLAVGNDGEDARTYHRLISQVLEQSGYIVSVDHPVPDRGDGRSGKIDIVAWSKDGWHTLAIELDRHSPRNKSIFKVKNYRPASGRLVIC